MIAYIKKKSEGFHINNLLIYPLVLEKQEQMRPKISSWKEIINIRAKIS
jgi:hypothetical protein